MSVLAWVGASSRKTWLKQARRLGKPATCPIVDTEMQAHVGHYRAADWARDFRELSGNILGSVFLRVGRSHLGSDLLAALSPQ